MIFIDDETKPAIIGTGSEDYFLGSWNFGGRDNARPFAYAQCGAPLIQSPERTGGRYCCYRFHGDNPVTFTRYLKHTMEHGHGNDRGGQLLQLRLLVSGPPGDGLSPAAAGRAAHPARDPGLRPGGGVSAAECPPGP